MMLIFSSSDGQHGHPGQYYGSVRGTVNRLQVSHSDCPKDRPCKTYVGKRASFSFCDPPRRLLDTPV